VEIHIEFTFFISAPWSGLRSSVKFRNTNAIVQKTKLGLLPLYSRSTCIDGWADMQICFVYLTVFNGVNTADR